MSARPIDLVLSRLKNVKPSGAGSQASCPCHVDQSPSLSVSEGDDGRVLLKCFAGCLAEDIVRSIGLTMADLFVTTTKYSVITVASLAADKGIPESFLRSLGLTDHEDGVVIPYKLPNGTIAPRKRLRTALRAKDGSLWMFGAGKPVPYGLDRLDEARAAGFLIVVEGESDSWTLWHHGFPALGIPGADMAGKLEARYLTGIPKIVVVREPGKGGDTFTSGTAKRLRVIGFKGQAATIGCGEFKDPNDLHRANPATFKSTFQAILSDASTMCDDSPGDHSEKTDTSESLDPLHEAGVLRLAMNPSLDAVEVSLRRLAELIAEQDDLARRVVRGRVIQHLTTLGVSGPGGLVDAAIKTAAKANDSMQGRSVILEPPTPWSESVDGAELLDEIVIAFEKYVILPPGAAIAIATWTLFTHALDAFTVAPMLTLVSPEKRCGKTTTLDVAGALVPRKLPAANISPAALYRTVETITPTLLVDEADAFLNRNEDLRGILNAGHTRSTAVVIRTVGDDHEPRQFSTWCPKLIASIGKLPSTIEDRSILVPMRRRAPGEKVTRLRRDRIDAELEAMRSKAARWAADNLEELRDADPAVPGELHDRAQDNWRPLFAIADIVGGTWPNRMREAALALHGRAIADDESTGVQLLTDIQALFQATADDAISSEVIVKQLVEMADRPWAEFSRGRGLTQNRLAKILRGFEVHSRSVRIDGKTPKGYRRGDLEDAFLRYLPQQPQQPQQDENGALFDPSANRNIPPSVALAENSEKARHDNVVAAVAVRKPEVSKKTDIQPLLPFTSMPRTEHWDI